MPLPHTAEKLLMEEEEPEDPTEPMEEALLEAAPHRKHGNVLISVQLCPSAWQ